MTTYTVQPGDSIWKIALQFQMGISEIIAANPQVKEPSLIYPGQQITIPLQDPLRSIEQKVIDLTNEFRQSHGLPALTSNWQLSRVARIKAEDMRDKNYTVHISPIYGPPLDMIQAFGITFQTVAENIAGGQTTPEEVVSAWMNHPPHRDNMLNSKLRLIGIGYAQGGSYGHYWSQMFVG